MNTINISDGQREIHLPKSKIEFWAGKTLTLLGLRNKTLSIFFTDDKGIKKLNKIYRDKNSPTDVLAFSMREGKFGGINPEILGDVVISAETAKRCAVEQKTTFVKELSLYLIHGILHLQGYRDDEKNKPEMQAKEKEIFEKIWNEEN